MKRASAFIAAIALAYCASGFYVVRGNERAAVRQFGRALRTSDGALLLLSNGLHYALPWPFSQVDRVRLNEVRTTAVGVFENEPVAGGILKSLAAANQSQYLTGDKNVLNLQLSVQYRVSELTAEDYLFHAREPERCLAPILQSVATSLAARSGVDFVHPLGQVELNGLLTTGVRELAVAQRLGLEIDDVTINAVYPPVQVKFYFLDVTGARADKANHVNAASAYAEQRLAAAKSEERRVQDQAASDRLQRVESARAQAESFSRLIEQFRNEQRSGAHSYAAARQTALRRYYLNVMRDVLAAVSAKVWLDSDEPANLTLFGKPAAASPKPVEKKP